MNAILQFRDYHVLESIYKNNLFKKIEEESAQHPNIFYKLDVNPNNEQQAIVGLGMELGDDSLTETAFYLKVRVAGFFEILTDVSEISEDEIIHYFKVNAVAILFPYLRSLVSDISSKGSEAPIILPTLNIAAMIHDNDMEESSEEFTEL